NRRQTIAFRGHPSIARQRRTITARLHRVVFHVKQPQLLTSTGVMSTLEPAIALCIVHLTTLEVGIPREAPCRRESTGLLGGPPRRRSRSTLVLHPTHRGS